MKYEVEIQGGRYDGIKINFDAKSPPTYIRIRVKDLEEAMGECTPAKGQISEYVHLKLNQWVQGELI